MYEWSFLHIHWLEAESFHVWINDKVKRNVDLNGDNTN